MSRRLVRAAALIALITALARLTGFGRTAVFARTVGSDCVGVVYQTANTIPNIVFDIVAGGTLSALVVPLLAPALGSRDRDRAGQIMSALLTWAVLILSGLAILIVVFAGPITRALLGPDQCVGADALGQRMLVVFAPQVLLYGLGVVLGGALQAAERFSWPALAPLLSSVVVIIAYLVYGSLVHSAQSASALSRSAELVLSVGTTVGVVVLAGCLLPAVLGLKLRIRPALRFPVGLAPLVRRAALAGGITLAAQQLATAIMLRLANDGIAGTLVVLTIAQAVYLLPWAVLAVPVATAVFPRMSAAWEQSGPTGAAELARRSVRIVSALAAIATAALVAASIPIANVLLDHDKNAHSVFGPSIAVFAVGLIGWSLVALLARVLYAARSPRMAAFGQAIGWLVTIVADLALAAVTGRHDRGVILALGNALGVTVAAILLVFGAWRVGVLPGLAGVFASCGRAGVAAALGAGAGWGVSRLAPGSGIITSVLIGSGAAIVGAGVTAALLAAADRELLQLLRQPRLLASGPGPS